MSGQEEENGTARVNAYVSPETKKWLLKYKKDYGKNSYGDVVEDLVNRVRENGQNQLLGEVLSEAIVTQVVDQLKNPLDILRRRTGYSDRQTKVITELLNHMITTLQIDKMPSEVATTDVSKTGALTAAEARIKEQLDHFAQQAATKKVERAVQKNEAGETE